MSRISGACRFRFQYSGRFYKNPLSQVLTGSLIIRPGQFPFFPLPDNSSDKINGMKHGGNY
jgi:hypothetical protein